MLTRVLFAIANLCHINYATDNVTVMRDTPKMCGHWKNSQVLGGDWNNLFYHASLYVWLGGQDAGLAINRSRVRIPASLLSSATLGKLLTHMCLCHQAV